MRALGGLLIRHVVMLVALTYAVAGFLLRDELLALDLRWLLPVGTTAHAGGAPAAAGSAEGFRPLSQAAPARPPPRSRVAPEPADTRLGGAPPGDYRFRPLHKRGNLEPLPPPVPGSEAGLPAAEAPGAGPLDVHTRLQSARRAFWEGDTTLAEARYLAAARAFPEEPGVFGELGNLYYQLGRLDAALDAYADAARLLTARGDHAGAAAIVRALGESDPGAAAELRRRLGRLSGPSGGPDASDGAWGGDGPANSRPGAHP